MTIFATANHNNSEYSVIETDCDGICTSVVRVRYNNTPDSSSSLADMATRLLVVARRLDGGWNRALEVLHAEAVRQQAEK